MARDFLRVLSWQRAHGSIARNRNNEAADRIAMSWSKLRSRCGKSVGDERSNERSKKQLIGRERRLVELTTKLIEVELGQWKQLAREAYLGFRSEFGDGFETNLQWIFKECAMDEISAVGHTFHRNKGKSHDSWDKFFLQRRPVSEVTETISSEKLNRLRGTSQSQLAGTYR